MSHSSQQAKKARQLVEEHVTSTEDSYAWVTDRVTFLMKDLIRQCRRNYWGVFKQEHDPQTGRKRIWMPLTEMMVEQVVKNIDMDQKDIRFRASHEDGYAMTELARAAVTDYLDKEYFGEDLDMLERDLCIDGTVVMKTYTDTDGKPKFKQVDLLNFYIDPQADSIQETERVVERSVMNVSKLREKDWENTEDIEGSTSVPNTRDGFRRGGGSGESDDEMPEVDVWEMWGLIPKHLVEEDDGEGEPDTTEYVEGHIVVSGIESGNDTNVHLIEENTEHEDPDGNPIKPYEEAWYHKSSNRWYGRGIAEKLLMLQLYLNTIVNIRINRSYISQLGLFKIREGSGVTPDQISNLAQNGAVVVDNMDDIQQWVMEDASQASYEDEKNIMQWARRLTSAFQAVTGEELPSSTTATSATMQQQGAESAFSMVRKSIDSFMQRWMDRHLKHRIVKQYAEEDRIRIVGDDQDIRKIYDRVVAYQMRDKFEEFRNETRSMDFESPEDVQEAIDEAEKFKKEHRKAVKKLREQPEVFVRLVEEISAKNLDTKMFMTDEEIDTGTVVKNLTEMMKVADPQTKQAMIKESFDLLGLDIPEMESAGPDNMPMDQQQIEKLKKQVQQEAGRGSNSDQQQRPARAQLLQGQGDGRGGARQGAGQMRTTNQPQNQTPSEQFTANNVRDN